MAEQHDNPWDPEVRRKNREAFRALGEKLDRSANVAEQLLVLSVFLSMAIAVIIIHVLPAGHLKLAASPVLWLGSLVVSIVAVESGVSAHAKLTGAAEPLLKPEDSLFSTLFWSIIHRPFEVFLLVSGLAGLLAGSLALTL